MALSQYLGAGQTLSQAVSARYSAIGEEKKRDALSELFKVRAQQREEMFKALSSLLKLGDSLAANYEDNKEINAAMKDDPTVRKTSGIGKDIFSTPTYERGERTGKYKIVGRSGFKFSPFESDTEKVYEEIIGNYKPIDSNTLYNTMMRNKYSEVNSGGF